MSRLDTPGSEATQTGDVGAADNQYDENGVDLSLVRHTLSLSPTERLKAVENYMKAVASVKVISRSQSK
jgi:hypothetical protein